MAKLPETVRQVERKVKNIKQSVQEVNKATKEVDRLTSLDGGEKTQKVEVKRATLGESLLGPTQEFLVGTALVFALLFFLLASGDLFLRKLVSVLPSFHDKKLAVEISHQIEHDVSRYLLAISCINAVFGAAVAVACTCSDCPIRFCGASWRDYSISFLFWARSSGSVSLRW